jgi:hypothetical protein
MGGYKLALRRNLGHAAALSVVLCLDAPIGGKPVYRWEKLLAANIMSEAKLFYEAHSGYLCDAESTHRLWSLGLYLYCLELQ